MPRIIQHTKGIGPGSLQRLAKLCHRRLLLAQCQIALDRHRAAAGCIAETAGGQAGGDTIAIIAGGGKAIELLIGPVGDYQRQPRLARVGRARKCGGQGNQGKHQPGQTGKRRDR